MSSSAVAVAVAPARIPLLPLPRDPAFLNLTDKEKWILLLLSQGVSRPLIAEQIGAKLWTVHTVVNRIVHRECCANVVHLVARYLEEYHGLLDPVWNKDK